MNRLFITRPSKNYVARYSMTQDEDGVDIYKPLLSGSFPALIYKLMDEDLLPEDFYDGQTKLFFYPSEDESGLSPLEMNVIKSLVSKLDKPHKIK
ncbi:Uncharacterised protein [uncultured archaeon]|nr:Uncharacterised protein [uncultured archaeon]